MIKHLKDQKDFLIFTVIVYIEAAVTFGIHLLAFTYGHHAQKRNLITSAIKDMKELKRVVTNYQAVTLVKMIAMTEVKMAVLSTINVIIRALRIISITC